MHKASRDQSELCGRLTIQMRDEEHARRRVVCCQLREEPLDEGRAAVRVAVRAVLAGPWALHG